MPAPEGDPDAGFGDFEIIGFTDAPADVVMSAEFGAAVVEQNLVVRRLVIDGGPDGEGGDPAIEGVDFQTFELPSLPWTYDLTSWTDDEDPYSFGCLLTYFDAEGGIHAVRISVADVEEETGAATRFSAHSLYAPATEDEFTGYPHHIFGDYDQSTRRMVALVGFTNALARYEGTKSTVYNWSATYQASGYLQTQDSIPTPGEGNDGDGEMEFIAGSTGEEGHPNVFPTGVVRYDRGGFLLTVVDAGPTRPYYREQSAIAGACVSTIIDTLGATTTMAGYVGRGFVERVEELTDDFEVETSFSGYLPYCTHDEEGVSSVHLLKWPELALVPNLAGQAHEVARIEGPGNWRPVGLYCIRFQEAEVIDPLFFDPLWFSFSDFLMGQLMGHTVVDVGTAVQDRVLVGISVPDQPPLAPNPRSLPCYLVMVDLQAQVAELGAFSSLDDEHFGAANVGDALRLNFGDVLRVASHPSGISWGVVGRWDDGSDVGSNFEQEQTVKVGLVDHGSWNLPPGTIL